MGRHNAHRNKVYAIIKHIIHWACSWFTFTLGAFLTRLSPGRGCPTWNPRVSLLGAPAAPAPASSPSKCHVRLFFAPCRSFHPILCWYFLSLRVACLKPLRGHVFCLLELILEGCAMNLAPNKFQKISHDFFLAVFWFQFFAITDMEPEEFLWREWRISR